MKHVKWKIFWNYEKEEEFLNSMSAKGLAFVSYFLGRYEFVDSKPGEYIYRIELLDNLISHPESRRYIAFMEETGAQLVDSWLRWAFFRKKASEGSFDIYSDLSSKIAHYKKVTVFFMLLMISNFLIGIGNFINGLERYIEDNSSVIGIILPFLNLMIAILILGYVYIPFKGKIRRLSKENKIHE